MSKLLNLFGLFLFSLPLFAQDVKVAGLSCGYRNNPIGIDFVSPELSWKLQSSKRNVMQTAYQVLVASSLANLNKNIGDFWDTKRVNSGQSIQIQYAGTKLISAKTYYWKVRVWDNFGKESAWSETAFWQMGLLNAGDWKGAKWIAFEKLADS
ncbi:MAG: alpha-L-rhamnosidase, partial [Sphingobacteriales bacterium]